MNKGMPGPRPMRVEGYHTSYVQKVRDYRYMRGGMGAPPFPKYRGNALIDPIQQAGTGTTGVNPAIYIPELDEIWYLSCDNVNSNINVYDARTRVRKTLLSTTSAPGMGADSGLLYDPLYQRVYIRTRGFGAAGGWHIYNAASRRYLGGFTYGSSQEYDGVYNPETREMWISSVDFGKAFNLKLGPGDSTGFYPGAGGDVPQNNQMRAMGYDPCGHRIWVAGNDAFKYWYFDATPLNGDLAMSGRRLVILTPVGWNTSFSMLYVPIEKQMWVSHYSAGQGVAIFDCTIRPTTNKYSFQLPGALGGLAMAYDAVRHCVYVSPNAASQSIYVYNPATRLLMETITTGRAAGNIRGLFMSPYRDLWMSIDGHIYVLPMGELS